MMLTILRLLGLGGDPLVGKRMVDTCLKYLDGLSAQAHGDPKFLLFLGNAYFELAYLQYSPDALDLGIPEAAAGYDSPSSSVPRASLCEGPGEPRGAHEID